MSNSIDSSLKYIGVELGKRRVALNISQKEMARHSGVSQRTITRLESGYGANLDSFLRICRVLDLEEPLLDVFKASEIAPIDLLKSPTKPSAENDRHIKRRVKRANLDDSDGFELPDWVWEDS